MVGDSALWLMRTAGWLGLLLLPSILFAPPPSTIVYRNWADLALAAMFITFATYKAVRLVKTTRLGWSFAIYNLVMAALFLVSIFVLPNVEFPPPAEGFIATLLRLLLVLAVLWCVIEVELSRKEIRDNGESRRGNGQQT